MSAKHTPGPWEICEHSWSDTGIYAGDKRIAKLSIYDEATEENQSELEKEMDANARLIAASPELLKALETIAEYSPDKSCGYELAEIAKEAIAKAKGVSA